MRIIRCKNSLTAVLSDGRVIQRNDCTDALFGVIRQLQAEDNEFELINLLIPEKADEGSETSYRVFCTGVVNKAKSSNILKIQKNGDGSSSMYWPSVSPLSLPPELADRILKAEDDSNTELLDTYKNFWTLVSLNPRAEVRRNLFRFLTKWGMTISKSGLFAGYRNADVKEHRDTPEATIYTDNYSHSTTIRIGHMTTMPREQVDDKQEHECSSGLHLGGTSWLERNYFGSVGLVCLCNPIDVCAVPWESAEYGKLRCCAYMPIAVAKYDETGHIIPYTDKDGFDSKYVKKILYDGVMSTETTPEYSVLVSPTDTGQSYRTVSDKLLEIARKFIQDK